MFFLSLLLIGSTLWIVIDLSYGRIIHLKRVRSRSFLYVKVIFTFIHTEKICMTLYLLI